MCTSQDGGPKTLRGAELAYAAVGVGSPLSEVFFSCLVPEPRGHSPDEKMDIKWREPPEAVRLSGNPCRSFIITFETLASMRGVSGRRSWYSSSRS